MLESIGLTVRVASDGQDAVEAYQKEVPDLIFMDCQMPGMNGYQACSEIRRLEAITTDGDHIPIIALTANVMENDREQCLASGMDDYLSKPVRRETLRGAVRQWLYAQ